MLLLQVSEDLEEIAMKEYSKFPQTSKLYLHHLMV